MNPYFTKRGKVARRIPTACQQCRAAKARCSGSHPCARCLRRCHTCVFPENDPKVTVSEKYLADLEVRAAAVSSSGPNEPRTAVQRSPPDPGNSLFVQMEGDSRRGATSTAATGWGSSPTAIEYEPRDSAQANLPQRQECQHIVNAEERPQSTHPQEERHATANTFTSNPLVKDALYIPDPAGRYRYMGPTSTWAFYRRIIILLEQHIPRSPLTPPDPFNTEGTAFQLEWTPVGPKEIPNLEGLPPADRSIYLFHTVKFHLGELSQLIHGPTFLSVLEKFNANPAQVAHKQRVWFVEYLLVLAFGEAFLAASGSASAPPGSEYAARAMALLPDYAHLHEEGLVSIEVLTLAALYFHSIDMRVSAFQLMGQALRLCYVEGIHRELPEEIFGIEASRRCRALWWAFYVFDRRLTALVGAPSSIRDEDITVILPSELNTSADAATLAISINLSRLLATITTRVYGVEESIGASFIQNTKDVILKLAEVVRMDNNAMDSNSQATYPSRVKSGTTLMYHHCIIQATRPLVMCLLKTFLGLTTPDTDRGAWISPPIVALLKTSIASAVASLKILCTLEKQRLMETFLPFDLEHVFSSAMTLCILQTILPSLTSDRTWSSMAHSVLDTMSKQGQVAAPLRKSELVQLEQFLRQLCPSGPVVESNGAILSPVAVARVDPLISDNERPYSASWDPTLDTEMASLDPHYLFDLACQLGMNPELDDMENV